MIKWSSNKAEMEIEAKIAQRAVAMAQKYYLQYDQMTAVMDIDATHNNGCPLKLAELLAADDTDFAHDVFGIRANLDRKTGKLMNCFVPRYACQEVGI